LGRVDGCGRSGWNGTKRLDDAMAGERFGGDMGDMGQLFLSALCRAADPLTESD
jgi:hypothetical protein